MDKIPDEILQIIFENLPSHFVMQSLSRVCKRWQALIRYRRLQVKNKDDLDLVHIGVVTIWMCDAHTLTLYSTSEVIAKAALQAPRLCELTIHAELWLNIKDFEVLASLKHLRHLDVFVDPHSVLTHAACCSQVSSLVINNTMTKEFLQTLQKQPELRMLQMYGLANNYPPKPLTKVLAAHKMHLTDLTLRCRELPDAGYNAIASCGELRHLRLYSCWLLRPATARRLAALPLRTLHLTGLVMVRARALLALVEALSPGVQELSLSASRAGDGAAAALARLPALRELELWRCDVSAAGLVAAAAALRALRALDTDAVLGAAHVRALAGAGLERLRCRLDGEVAAPPRLALRRADAPLARGSRLRAEGQGPASARFYHWEPGAPP